jgi:hypothetical protein
MVKFTSQIILKNYFYKKMSVRKTRSGKILSDLPIKKRNYKRKRNSTESLQDATQSNIVVQSPDQPCSSAQAQAQEIASNNSNISESFNLVLEEENISNWTFDEYDRLVPHKDYYKEVDTENGLIIEENIIQEMYDKVKKSKKGISHIKFIQDYFYFIKLINLGQKKATPYEPIDDRSFTFENQADVDTYIRMNNQCDCIITHNNPVKCSFRGCHHTNKHQMKSIYRKCKCKQPDCSLKYHYQKCDYSHEWQLFKQGSHPQIENYNNGNYGIPLKILEIIEDYIESNPDTKPSDVHSHIIKKRRINEKLAIELATQKLNDSNYIATDRQKKINTNFVFDKKLVPDLKKVTHLCLL